jgi:hypothetical protein
VQRQLSLIEAKNFGKGGAQRRFFFLENVGKACKNFCKEILF